jgi:hypothetical protein
VFQNAIRYAITESGRLGALLSVFQVDHDFGKWPSWVPRWDHEFDPDDFIPPFHSDNDVEMNTIDFVDRAASLCVHGLVLDVVAKVLPAFPVEQTARRWREKFAEIEAEIEALPCNPLGNVEAQIASTLSAGGASSHILMDDQEALEGYRAYKQYVTDGDFAFVIDSDTSTDQERQAGRLKGKLNIARKRSFFHTEDGYIGLGPQATEPGDLLVILYGSGYPAVLRPHKDEGWFFFVGLAYVHGIMNGEAVRESKGWGLEDTLFCII